MRGSCSSLRTSASACAKARGKTVGSGARMCRCVRAGPELATYTASTLEYRDLAVNTVITQGYREIWSQPHGLVDTYALLPDHPLRGCGHREELPRRGHPDARLEDPVRVLSDSEIRSFAPNSEFLSKTLRNSEHLGLGITSAR